MAVASRADVGYFMPMLKNNSFNFTPLQQALKRLEASIKYTQKAEHGGAVEEFETLRAGTIQAFEFCYELYAKNLRRFLENMHEVPRLVEEMPFPEVLIHAAERGLPVNKEEWLAFRNWRNQTSHTYDEDTARTVYVAAPLLASRAATLLAALQAFKG
jgi:nucleotidyltransferase substrate binding protein (TIGR01987 family)